MLIKEKKGNIFLVTIQNYNTFLEIKIEQKCFVFFNNNTFKLHIIIRESQ